MSARLGAAALLVLPVAANACPVCFAADERAAWIYGVSTWMLSLLPFAIVGALAVVVHRMNRE